MQRADIALERLNAADAPSATGPDLAQIVRSGRAECGIATRAVADAAGLHFVPLIWERFDLVMRQRDYFGAPMQTLMSFLRSAAFAAQAGEMGGYEIADAGAVRFVH